jgi:phage virion morphogenesis protein
MTVEIEYNDAQVSAALQRLVNELGDASGIMSEIGDHLIVSTRKRMDEEVSPEETAWAPRSEATLAAYRRRKLSYGGVLHLSGQMWQGLKTEIGADYVIVGSPEPYAAVMQFGAAKGAFGTTSRGASIPWGDIPARPFLGVSDEDHTAILDIVSKALARALAP